MISDIRWIVLVFTTLLVAAGGCDPTANLDPDNDGDGFVRSEDCDDQDADTYPGADELCDGLDNDCDGDVPADEIDDDGDGFAECEGDCADAEDSIHPDATEVCNAIDDDCDGITDEGFDADGDGYTTCGEDGVPGNDDDDCDDGDADLNHDDDDADSYSTCDGDCDDSNDSVNPGATEICDGLDNDCDGDLLTSEVDADGDGYLACDDDCDDENPEVHPGATELCNGVDDNCNGSPAADEADADADGHMVCAGDCDDADEDVFPGAPQLCDGVLDNDCDGVTDDNEGDADGDGSSECDGDCDDANALLNPDDGDLDGYSTCDGDCDDAEPDAHPGHAEVPGDGIDNDCDGWVDEVDPGAPVGTIDLSLAHAKLLGEEPDDLAGSSVAGAGDVNNDGYDDILVGAEMNWEGGYSAGAAYLLHGPISGTVDLSSADAKFVGEEPNDYSGCAVAGAGDINGDGYDDVLVGALFHSGYQIDDGAAYLFYGPISGTVDLSSADAKWTGADYDDKLGETLFGPADVNSDGFDDVILGAPYAGGQSPGETYLFYGPIPTGTTALSSTADASFWGTDSQGRTSQGLSSGDLDGDGNDDLVIGTRINEAYLVYGGSGGNAPSGSQSVAFADATIMASGIDERYFGKSVSGSGDIDGDGFDDVLIADPENGPNKTYRGAVFLFHGGTSGQTLLGAISLASSDAKLEGEADEDYAGESTAIVGDVNSDGYDDVLIGAPWNDEGAPAAGAGYLLYGPIPGDMNLSQADAKFLGGDFYDAAGRQVAGAGDVNGDGFMDLLIASEFEDEAGQNAGAVYLILGGSGP